MKIFVDCHVFDTGFQGTTTYIKGIYSEWIKDKTRHFFLAANDLNKLQEVFGLHENVTFVQYRWHNKFLRLLWDIPSIIRKHNIDFAHFQYIVPPIKQCRYIVTVHDLLFLDLPEYFPWTYRVKNKFLFQQSSKISEVLLTVSEYSKKQLERHFGMTDVIVTPNAVDPVFYEGYEKSEIQKEVKAVYGLDRYLVYVSRWEPRKNHHLLLKVFAEHGFYKEHKLVLIGERSIHNPEFDQYFQTLSQEVKDQVVLLSKVGFEQLLLLLRGSDLAVYPSLAEGFGIPPLEAAAAGVPSLFSKTTAMGDFEFMKEMMFDPYSETDLAEKIKANLVLRSHPDYSREIAQRYNWELSTRILAQAVDKIS